MYTKKTFDFNLNQEREIVGTPFTLPINNQFQTPNPQSSSTEFNARLRLATALCCCSQASRRFRKVVKATFRATWWPKGSLISSWFCSPAKGTTHV